MIEITARSGRVHRAKSAGGIKPLQTIEERSEMGGSFARGFDSVSSYRQLAFGGSDV